MVQYILMATLAFAFDGNKAGYGGATSVMQEFNSLEACEEARTTWLKNNRVKVNPLGLLNSKVEKALLIRSAECVKK